MILLVDILIIKNAKGPANNLTFDIKPFLYKFKIFFASEMLGSKKSSSFLLSILPSKLIKILSSSHRSNELFFLALR